MKAANETVTAASKNATNNHCQNLVNKPLDKTVSRHSAPLSSNGVAKVLLVEDNPMAMRIASLLLEKAQCQTLQAFNATEALKLCRNHRFDFILTDIGLPDFSGFELAQKIHDLELQQGPPPTPIIGLSAHAKKDTLSMAEGSSMVDVCEKPLKMETLLQYIEQYSKQHSPAPNTEINECLNAYQHIPLFSAEKALEQLGNQETVKELLQYMLDVDFTDSLMAIEQAYQQQNWDDFKSLVHKFKSSCLYCATERLLDITQTLEKEALNPDAALKAQLYQDFQSIGADTKEHLKDWLARQ